MKQPQNRIVLPLFTKLIVLKIKKSIQQYKYLVFGNNIMPIRADKKSPKNMKKQKLRKNHRDDGSSEEEEEWSYDEEEYETLSEEEEEVDLEEEEPKLQ